MSRRYLIIASVAAHAAFGVGMFVSGIWSIERLDAEHRARLTIGAIMPPGEPGGGEGEKQETKEQKKPEKKKPRKVIKDELRQVEKTAQDEPVEVASASTGGGGEGDGEGPDVGPGTGGGRGGTCDPLVDPGQCQPTPAVQQAVCGDGVRASTEQCDDGNLVDGDKCSAKCTMEVVIIPPAMFAGLRISGETQIVPPDTVKTQMLRDGKDRTVGSFKMCIDEGGRISSISPTGRGTGYAGYDTKITTAMRSWRYQPYRISSRGTQTAVPACSVVTFVYTIK